MLPKGKNNFISACSAQEAQSSYTIIPLKNKMKKLGKLERKILNSKLNTLNNEKNKADQYSDLSTPNGKSTNDKQILISQNNDQNEGNTKKIKSSFNAFCNFKNLQLENNGLDTKQIKISNIKTTKKKTLIQSQFCDGNIFDIQLQAHQNSNIGIFKFLNYQGIHVGFFVEVVKAVMLVIIGISLLALFSIQVIFKSYESSFEIHLFKILLLLTIFIIIVTNFILTRKQGAKSLLTISQISISYFKQQFLIDFLCFLVLLFDTFSHVQQLQYFRFIYVFRIRDLEAQLSKLDYLFTIKFYKEQYWRLVRLIASNFFIAHIFALLMLMMAEFQSGNNWLVKAGHDGKCELEKYLWAYYWSVTTMMSVGYGDLTPCNYKQAICLIFIQSISCITMAYTINCVGELMLNIRARGLQRQKKQKIFKQLLQNNRISSPVQQKVSNYIQQTIQIKKRFNQDEHNNFINELPQPIKCDLLYDCHARIFQGVHVMQVFATETIRQLAYKVELFIAHPQEILLNTDPFTPQIKFLKQGKISYIPVNPQYKPFQINTLKVNQSQNPQLISQLNYPIPTPQHYQIRSEQYSLIYQISYDKFLQCVRKSPLDYQLLCLERDRHKKCVPEMESIECQLCSNKRHLKIFCPKLHFLPYKAAVICRFLENVKIGKNARNKYWRIQKNYQKKNYSNHVYRNYEQFMDCKIGQFSNQSIENEEQSQIRYFQLLRNILKGGEQVQQSSIPSKQFDKSDNVIENSEQVSKDKQQKVSKGRPKLRRSSKNVQKKSEKSKQNKRQSKNASTNGNNRSKCSLRTFKNFIQSSPYFEEEYLNNRNMKYSHFEKQCKKMYSMNSQYAYPYLLQLTENLDNQSYKINSKQRQKRILHNLQLQQMFGINCDVIHDFQKYFPVFNSLALKNKSLKISFSTNWGGSGNGTIIGSGNYYKFKKTLSLGNLNVSNGNLNVSNRNRCVQY